MCVRTEPLNCEWLPCSAPSPQSLRPSHVVQAAASIRTLHSHMSHRRVRVFPTVHIWRQGFPYRTSFQMMPATVDFLSVVFLTAAFADANLIMPSLLAVPKRSPCCSPLSPSDALPTSPKHQHPHKSLQRRRWPMCAFTPRLHQRRTAGDFEPSLESCEARSGRSRGAHKTSPYYSVVLNALWWCRM